MSYIKKIESDYSKGNITLDQITELRKKYQNASDFGKNQMDEAHAEQQESIEKELANNSRVEPMKQETLPSSINYFFTSIIMVFYALISMSIETDGDFSRYYHPFEEFIIQVKVAVVISFTISGIAYLFKRKTAVYSKTLLYTTIIMLGLSLLGKIMR